MDPNKIKTIVEAALMAAGRPLSIDDLLTVFGDFARPENKAVREAISALQADYEGRAVEIKEVASGFRIQVRTRYTEFVSRLWDERPPRYSRALLETLALIAYRQPITRGEIEDIRGVSVSTNIVRTLLERNWARVVGHRDVPGRPAMFGTTKEFLDYFGLSKLDDLPSLQELRDIDDMNVQLEFPSDAQDGAQQPADTGIPADEQADPDAPRMHLVRDSGVSNSGADRADEAVEEATDPDLASHS